MRRAGSGWSSLTKRPESNEIIKATSACCGISIAEKGSSAETQQQARFAPASVIARARTPISMRCGASPTFQLTSSSSSRARTGGKKIKGACGFGPFVWDRATAPPRSASASLTCPPIGGLSYDNLASRDLDLCTLQYQGSAPMPQELLLPAEQDAFHSSAVRAQVFFRGNSIAIPLLATR